MACTASAVRRDVLGGLGRLTGKRLNLARDHSKSPAGFAGARRLDGRIQRKQIGLAGNVADQFHRIADLLRRG